MSSLVHQLAAARWSIVSVDPEVDLQIDGQYQPDSGWEDTADPVVSASGTVGSSRPAAVWIAGGARQVTVSTSFRSLHFGDDIRPKIELLRALRNLDAALGRAPRVTLTWGELSITGFVTACPIRIQGYWATRLPRGCAFSITITEAEPLGIDSDLPTTGETQFVTLRDGETFETLARRYYRRADKGDLIRRQNPEIADQEGAGDRVKVLEAEHPSVRRAVRPTGVPFLDRTGAGETWQPVVESLAESRGGAGDLGLEWDRLPEVVSGVI